jgi:signal transduction histidine kinase
MTAVEPHIDTLPCGIITISDDGLIRSANRMLCAIIDRTQEELVGKHVEQILSPGGRIFFQTHLFPLVRIGGSASEIYLTLNTASGEDVPVMLNAVRQTREEATFINIAVMPMERRDRYEEEILNARRAAETANASKDRFLSMVSHELRNPLGSIIGFAELLVTEARGPVAALQKQDLKRILSAGNHLSSLVDDILDFSRLNTGLASVSLAAVPLEPVTERAEALITHLVERRRLRFNVLGDISESVVQADERRLLQILLNLLTNAIKFTHEEGSVSIEVSRGADDTISMAVRDTGIGIEPSDLERIFEPFVQLEDGNDPVRNQGVGLGLTISRQLARAMNGDLLADSTLGKGSVFTIILPVAGTA